MKTLHIISHTHWDREWYRTFQQFRLRLVHLIDGLLDLLERDPQFRYFMLDGQTIVLDDYLHMRPENEDILRRHIQSGRILIGPWHILPDMFLVGPEAHVRNLLQGERTARRFGPKMTVGYIPDPFGHPAQVPQILRGFGIDTACVWRGLDDQPAEFWWQAPDGSRVLMAYLRESYSNGASLPAENPPAFAAALLAAGEALAAHSAAQDYLIMLGTDHMEPPPDTAAAIAYADANLPGWRAVHSTLPAYIEALRASVDLEALPAFSGELRACRRMHLLPGVLSARMWIKQRNRACENLLTRWVEPFSTFAWLLDHPVGAEGLPPLYEPENHPTYIRRPAGLARQAWRLLMENHPHDSICGCSLDQVHDEMKPRFDQVEQIGEELTQQSLERLAGGVTTQKDAPDLLAALVVFNPLNFTRSDAVQVEITLPPGASGFEIVDESGQVLAHETLGLGTQEIVNARMSPDDLRSAFAMISEGRVMGLGIRTLDVRRDGAEASIDVTFTQGEPDKVVWERGVGEVKALLEDTDIAGFQVRARTADLIQAVFRAPDVPGLGWRTFYVRAKAAHSAPVSIPPLAKLFLPLAGKLAATRLGGALIARLQRDPANRPPYIIENEFYKVEVEPAGTLAVTDRRDGRVYWGLNRFVDGADCGDTYNYSPPPDDLLAQARLKRVSVRRGAVRQSLTLELVLRTPAALSPYRQSRATEMVDIPIRSTVTLVPGVARVEVHTEVDNRAADHRLRVHFPTPFAVEQALYDGHFGFDARPIGIPEFDRQTWGEDPRPEVPQRAFAHLAAAQGGFTLANRGLPEIEAISTSQETELALTLLRCVGWLSRDDYLTRRSHAGPFYETPGAQMSGKWAFDYAFCFHASVETFRRNVSTGAPHEMAYAFETPLRAVCTGLHAGSLPSSGSFVALETVSAAEPAQPAPFILSAVKEAEDDEGWLVRGYNPGHETLALALKPVFPFAAAWRANLAEERLEALGVDAASGSVRLEVRGGEIVSVLFSPAECIRRLEDLKSIEMDSRGSAGL